VQKLGEDLLTLRTDLLLRLDLPEKLVEALAESKRISNFEGKRRQMQFIGKLMRKLEPETHEAIRTALVEQHTPSALETQTLHQSEMWRDRLIADDDALGQWINLSPSTDSQQLRALVRQARKDAVPERAGQAQRHTRAYRDIFQLVRAQLMGENNTDDAALPPKNPGADA